MSSQKDFDSETPARISSSFSPFKNSDNLSGVTVYRVTESFLANSSEGGRFLTVKKGSFLTVESKPKQFGLIEAMCLGQRLLVFTRDLERCAEYI